MRGRSLRLASREGVLVGASDKACGDRGVRALEERRVALEEHRAADAHAPSEDLGRDAVDAREAGAAPRQHHDLDAFKNACGGKHPAADSEKFLRARLQGLREQIPRTEARRARARLDLHDFVGGDVLQIGGPSVGLQVFGRIEIDPKHDRKIPREEVRAPRPHIGEGDDAFGEDAHRSRLRADVDDARAAYPFGIGENGLRRRPDVRLVVEKIRPRTLDAALHVLRVRRRAVDGVDERLKALSGQADGIARRDHVAAAVSLGDQLDEGSPLGFAQRVLARIRLGLKNILAGHLLAAQNRDARAVAALEHPAADRRPYARNGNSGRELRLADRVADRADGRLHVVDDALPDAFGAAGAEAEEPVAARLAARRGNDADRLRGTHVEPHEHRILPFLCRHQFPRSSRPRPPPGRRSPPILSAAGVCGSKISSSSGFSSSAESSSAERRFS